MSELHGAGCQCGACRMFRLAVERLYSKWINNVIRFWHVYRGRVVPLTPFSVASWCCGDRRGVVLLGTREEAEHVARWDYFSRK